MIKLIFFPYEIDLNCFNLYNHSHTHTNKNKKKSLTKQCESKRFNSYI